MLGFGGRKKYNGAVDIKLNNEYQIATRDNPSFPGTLAYLELIDNAWAAKMSEDEGALYIATLYYCGILKHGLHAEASALHSRIQSIVGFGLPKGMISQARWAKFSAAIQQANLEAGITWSETKSRLSSDAHARAVPPGLAGMQPAVGLRFVPCRNPSCGNTPLNIEVGQARALLDHDLRNNPTAAFTLACDRCGLESHYSHAEILALIDPQRRPQPLPEGRHWALVPYELSTAESMEHRGFFAERVLVEIQTRMPDAWTGTLLGSSLFAPSLRPGAQIGGPTVSTFLICQWWVSGQRQLAISVQDVPKGSVFGVFFGNKGRQLVDLQRANLFCSNPSCNFVFSPTYSQVKEMLAGAHEKPIAAETTPTLMFTCELCGTSRVVDESSFTGLFHV